MKRRIRMPVEPTYDERGRAELLQGRSRLIVPIGEVRIGPLPHETLRAHVVVDVVGQRARWRLHLRGYRASLVVDLAHLDELERIVGAAKQRAEALGRAA